MPLSNEEARLELEQMRKDRDLSKAWIARQLGENQMWVHRLLAGKVPMRIDDYGRLKEVITSVSPRERLFN